MSYIASSELDQYEEQALSQGQLSQDIQGELRKSLAILAIELSLKIKVSYVAASLFQNASPFFGGFSVCDSDYIPYDSKLYMDTLSIHGVVNVCDVDIGEHFEKIHSPKCGSRIKSYLGVTVKNRNGEAIGVLYAFSPWHEVFSAADELVIQAFAQKASAMVEVLNVSEALKSIHNKKKCREVFEYLTTLAV